MKIHYNPKWLPHPSIKAIAADPIDRKNYNLLAINFDWNFLIFRHSDIVINVISDS